MKIIEYTKGFRVKKRFDDPVHTLYRFGCFETIVKTRFPEYIWYWKEVPSLFAKSLRQT